MDKEKYWGEKFEGEREKSNPQSSLSKKAIEYLRANNLSKVLDLGAGLGVDTQYFVDEGVEVTVVEIAEPTVRYLKEKFPDSEVVLTDIKDMVFPKNNFDLVYARLSLHYFMDKETDEVFENIYNILKPGGFLIAECKSPKDKYYGLGEKVEENVYVHNHLRHFFTPDYFVEKARKLKIIDVGEDETIRMDKKIDTVYLVAQKI